MARNDQTILVTGATGHQGGAAARHLLADGWKVRALVRDPQKPAARALAATGVELVPGDLTDRASLDAAVAGAYGVYSLQTPVGVEQEVAEAKNLADAAMAAGVRHFVQSSVIGADRPSVLPWVAGKVEIEAYLHALGMPLTIFRPVTFMENLLHQRDGILAGKLTGFMPADSVHQWIAADDIGRFIALAFYDPDTWVGRTTEIAGDELTEEQGAAVLSMVLGTPVVYEQQAPPAGMPTPPPVPADAPAPHRADVAKLRESIPDLVTLVVWATNQHAAGIL
ncbi:MAG: NmrA/HSCARG family protein [Coriobacteriia bacterium]|nr:NmrA/HSCARG family protein [Coriobacteriia bacterium]